MNVLKEGCVISLKNSLILYCGVNVVKVIDGDNLREVIIWEGTYINVLPYSVDDTYYYHKEGKDTPKVSIYYWDNNESKLIERVFVIENNEESLTSIPIEEVYPHNEVKRMAYFLSMIGEPYKSMHRVDSHTLLIRTDSTEWFLQIGEFSAYDFMLVCKRPYVSYTDIKELPLWKSRELLSNVELFLIDTTTPLARLITITQPKRFLPSDLLTNLDYFNSCPLNKFMEDIRQVLISLTESKEYPNRFIGSKDKDIYIKFIQSLPNEIRLSKLFNDCEELTIKKMSET